MFSLLPTAVFAEQAGSAPAPPEAATASAPPASSPTEASKDLALDEVVVSATRYAGELFAAGNLLLSKEYVAFSEPDPDGNSFHPGPKREVFVGARVKFGK